MTREEALAAGMEVHETQHSMKRRTPWHDYSRKGTYMLTLVVQDRVPLLGTLRSTIDPTAAATASGSGDAERAYVELSAVGRAIVEEEQKKINRYYPQVEVWKLCVMPDHLHMIVRVKEDMGEGCHLGFVIRGFKAGCTKAWWSLTAAGAEAGAEAGAGAGAGVETPGMVAGTVPGMVAGTAAGAEAGAGVETPGTVAGMAPGTVAGTVARTVAGMAPGTVAGTVARTVAGATVREVSTSAGRPSLFEKGYCDKILLHDGQLDNWKRYLDDNPRRLLMKRRNPDLFTVLSGMEVAGEPCQVVGNRFLLNIPDKMAVIVHRRYTDEEYARLRAAWLACGERGGVLVSAAISPKEKAVLREAMNLGYRIILLKENGFPKLYKPSGEAFDACAAGLLLQISPWEYHMEKRSITRGQCLHLNSLAERISLEFSV